MPNNKGGEMKMGETVERAGVTAEVLDRKGFLEHMRDIKELRYNPLNTALNKAPSTERQDGLTEMREDIAVSDEHDLFVVAKDGDKVVGFLAMKKHLQDGFAQAREMWTAMSGSAQRPVIRSLIQEAKKELTHHELIHLKLHIAPEEPSEEFDFVARQDWNDFLVVAKKEDAPPSAQAPGSESLEKGH